MTTFKDELEEILDKLLYDLTTKKPDVVKTAITSIINLVHEEIIGEDEIEEKYKHLTGEDDMYEVGRDDLREEQRAKLKGVSNDL